MSQIPPLDDEYQVENNSKLRETLFLSQYWIYLYHRSPQKATSYLEDILRKLPHNLHYRTELAKIYQHQGKYDEAEKVLLEILSISLYNCCAMSELISVYSKLENPDKCI